MKSKKPDAMLCIYLLWKKKTKLKKYLSLLTHSVEIKDVLLPFQNNPRPEARGPREISGSEKRKMRSQRERAQ